MTLGEFSNDGCHDIAVEKCDGILWFHKIAVAFRQHVIDKPNHKKPQAFQK